VKLHNSKNKTPFWGAIPVKGGKPTLLAKTSERSLVTSNPGATGKFSGIPLEIHCISTGNQRKFTGNQSNFTE